MGGKRYVVEFSEAAAAELESMRQDSGMDDIGQMTVGAVRLLREVVQAQQAGKRVVMLDPQTGERVELPSMVA